MKHSLLFAAALAFAGVSTHAAADPKSDLVDAFGKAMAKGTFKTTVITEGDSPAMEMRVILPDRFHMKTPDTEMIILPQGTWMNAEGEWMHLPMNMSKMIEGYSQKGIEQGVNAMTDVKVVGSETVEGCESTLYSYRTTGKFMGVENDSTAEVAVCDETGMPVRVVTKDKAGKPEAKMLYDFTGDFEINPPN